jgi:hypothetical protein
MRRTMRLLPAASALFLKAMAVLPDADAALGHRALEKSNESFDLPPPKKK